MKMKKLLAILVATIMVLSLGAIAFAADSDGKITITNAKKGETYTVYKLATLNSFDKEKDAYSYSVVDEWRGFFATEPAYEVFTVTTQGGYLIFDSDSNTTDIEGIAKAALAYAKENEIQAVVSSVAEADGELEFNDLALGYYLVDTTMGTLCSINTTDTDAEIVDKNVAPTVNKMVKEDSEEAFDPNRNTNDADINQVVEFATEIVFMKGGTNYVLHDKMDKGLTLDANSFAVYKDKKGVAGNEALDAATYYEVKTEGLTDGCTFEIEFTQALCDSVTEDSENIYVYYNAVLNEDAKVGTAAQGGGNKNETWLNYGDAQETTHDTTTTYTYEFEVVKTDKDGNYLPGATFSLWTAETSGREIALVKNEDGTYRKALSGETAEDISLENGQAVKITGLDVAKYYLQEETAPTGYNKLVSRQLVTISATNGNLNVSDEGKEEAVYDNGYGGVQVINNKGQLLPSTGGFGTTVFYVTGTILVLGAVVVLVAKRRAKN